MPLGLQYLAELSPLRHYMDAILGIFFKGVGLDMLWHRVVAMAVIGVALLAGGILQLRRRMR
jgi:ABC-2 type transport system permease protein